jgi:DNA processing protein
LINQGAQIILGEAELLELLGSLPALAQPITSEQPQQLSLLSPAAPVINLEPELEQVLQAVASEPIAVDLIVQKAGLATGSVLSALAQLELMGLVDQLPGMRYQRA